MVCHSERWQTSFICRSSRWLGLSGYHNPEIETLRRVAGVLEVEFDLKIPQQQEPTLSSRPSAKAGSSRSHSRAPVTGVRDSDDLSKAAIGMMQ